MSAPQCDVYVTMTGPALSRLLYENAQAPGNQVGFLLGSVLHQVTDSISDSEISNEKNETSINIDSIVPLPKLYDNTCEVNEDRIIDCLSMNRSKKDHRGDFIGWYSYNKKSTFHFSLRELTIHRQLSKITQKLSPGCNQEHFVFCLLSCSGSKATHAFKHSFMRFLEQKKSFEVIPMKILNLGASQQLQYQVRACSPKTALFQKQLMDSIVSGKELSEKDNLLHLQTVIQTHLMQGASNVCRTEAKLSKLREEVKQLRDKLEQQKKCKSAKEFQKTFSDNTLPSKEEHINHGTARIPVTKEPDAVTANPTSPVFQRQTMGRGRNKSLRLSTSGE